MEILAVFGEEVAMTKSLAVKLRVSAVVVAETPPSWTMEIPPPADEPKRSLLQLNTPVTEL